MPHFKKEAWDELILETISDPTVAEKASSSFIELINSRLFDNLKDDSVYSIASPGNSILRLSMCKETHKFIVRDGFEDYEYIDLLHKFVKIVNDHYPEIAHILLVKYELT